MSARPKLFDEKHEALSAAYEEVDNLCARASAIGAHEPDAHKAYGELLAAMERRRNALDEQLDEIEAEARAEQAEAQAERGELEVSEVHDG